MKRFRFQLEPVLNYKQQSLESLLVELDMIQGQVMAQEFRRDEAYQRVADYAAEYLQKKQTGLTVVEAMEYESCQRVLERRARLESDKLAELKIAEEKKRGQVVDARLETKSLEKLKDLRRNEYDTAAAKAEEKFLDDLTASRLAAG